MPLPLILGIGAAIAAAGGVGTGIHGGVKMKEANDTMKSADTRHKNNIKRFEEQNVVTSKKMDKLGEKELKILKSFTDFSDVFEKIKNRPEFKPYKKDGVEIPEYNSEELKKVSVGAGVLLGGIGGSVVGTAGGFAAAGATTAAVMALGTASTGTAIATLSGVAATNATLAALGGGALAAGGGGMALGTTLLGAATLGVGLLVGGVIFSVTGSSLSGKADEAWSQMKRAEKEIDKIVIYMIELSEISKEYRKTLKAVNKTYKRHFEQLITIVNVNKKTDWKEFTIEEKLITENCALLVGLLYNMCKVQLVLKSEDENKPNQINHKEIEKSLEDVDKLFISRELVTI